LWRGTGIVVLALVVALASGCAVMDGALNQALGGAMEKQTQQMMSGLFTFDDVMLFNFAYMQVFFVGGFGSGISDYEETQGTVWKVETNDSEENSGFNAERALLKSLPDGNSWWYLRYESEGDNLEYEVLLDKDYQPLEMYYRTSEDPAIRHHVFEQDQTASSSEESEDLTPEEQQQLESAGANTYVYTGDEYSQYKKDRVTVSVGAGTYQADYLVYTYSDEETGETVEYHWWTTKEVPGDLVKYDWINSDNGSEVTGELVSVKKGYNSRLGAF